MALMNRNERIGAMAVIAVLALVALSALLIERGSAHFDVSPQMSREAADFFDEAKRLEYVEDSLDNDTVKRRPNRKSRRNIQKPLPMQPVPYIE